MRAPREMTMYYSNSTNYFVNSVFNVGIMGRKSDKRGRLTKRLIHQNHLYDADPIFILLFIIILSHCYRRLFVNLYSFEKKLALFFNDIL